MTDLGKPNILLLYSFLKVADWKNKIRVRENLALGYLTAFLRQEGFKVDMLNGELLSLDNSELLDKIASKNNDYQIIGVSCTAQRGYLGSKDLINGVRQLYPKAHITMGGVFPSLAHLEVLNDLPALDSVVRGEGEYVLLDIANAIWKNEEFNNIKGLSYRKDGEIQVNPYNDRIVNLDTLPFPARDDLPFILETGQSGQYAAIMTASRGCYADCSFCSIYTFYGDRQRHLRSPKNVVDELEMLVKDYGVTSFNFEDDTFFDRSKRSRQWAHEFSEEIIRRGLKIKFSVMVRATDIVPEIFLELRNAGLWEVMVGVESGVQRLLDKYNKRVSVEDNMNAMKALEALGGLSIRIGYIMFEPDMTFDELRQNFQWLKAAPYSQRLNVYNKLNLYYGTPIVEELSREGRVTKGKFYQRSNYSFSDEKVAVFSDIVDEIKQITLPMTDKLAQLEVKVLRDAKMNQNSPGDLGVDQRLKQFELFELEDKNLWFDIFDELIAVMSQNKDIDKELPILKDKVIQRSIALEERLVDALN